MTKWQDHIITDATILNGKPCVKGTRLSVEFIINLLATGWSEDKILENYPRLTREDLNAIFAYLLACMNDGLFYQMPGKTG